MIETPVYDVRLALHREPAEYTLPGKQMSKQRMCTLVFLFEHERRILRSIADDTHLSPKTRRRARALLLTDRVEHPVTTDGEVAEETGLCPATIATLRKRYTSSGLTEAINPHPSDMDRIMAMRLQDSEATYFSHFASRRRGR